MAGDSSWELEFVRNPETREPYSDRISIGTRIGKRALEHGLLTRFDPNWIALGPPLILTPAEADQIVEILDRSIQEVLEELEDAE